MGVNQLWNILEPVKRSESLSSLRNKTLCVDLSCWICEARSAKGLKQNVSKPHLRNLFFRLLHLTRLGVKLVFVVDGEPPELKWEAILRRIQARNAGQNWRTKNSQKTVTGHGSGARVGRSHFDVWVRECRKLLELVGVPCIESKGEAEALCAWLDLHQIVDGCITNDGDAFLYGARTVYKDLCISGKDASVECYKMADVEAQLNLNRKTLVALAVLLGCDYLPQGVSGVGKEIAMKLIRSVDQDNLIDRFCEWTKSTCQDKDLPSVEKLVRSKALKDKNFPHHKVIQEFLAPKVVPQRVSLKIMNPELRGLQEFCLRNLDWPEEYTQSKVLPLITYWQMTSLLDYQSTTLVQPEKIVKARIQQKVECYEIEWQNVGLGETCPDSFVTVETRELVNKVYPEIEEEFKNAVAAKSLKKTKRKQAQKVSTSRCSESEIDSLSKQMKDLSVEQLPEDCFASSITAEKVPESAAKIWEEDSLQDIIDSILPSGGDHHCNSMESCASSEGLKDGNTGSDFDNDSDEEGRCDRQSSDDTKSVFKNVFKPPNFKINVKGNTDINPVFKSRDENHTGLDKKDSNNLESKVARVDSDLLHCMLERRENKECSCNHNASVTSHIRRKLDQKRISCSENYVVVDSSDEDDYSKEPCLEHSLKTKMTNNRLNGMNLSEIFGSSDLWCSDDDDEVLTSLEPDKPSSFLHSTSQLADSRNGNACLSRNTGVTETITSKFEVHCAKSTTKECNSNVLQEAVYVKPNTVSGKDKDCSPKVKKVTIRKRNPCKSFVKDSQTNTQCGGVNEANIVRSPEVLQKQESWKENNINYLFADEDLSVPLLERIRKNLSTRPRLTSKTSTTGL
ncbi:flap endonuclease GEN homolog 1-like [Montipora foliosa]|uniref:flap endonuclease GEN homolog 1-like n=1 Tax=Montipora foliosa TaxID=591990 RepID=UPI0035F16039